MASKVDPYAHLLGDVPDEKIAEMAGVKTATVKAYRLKLEGAADLSADPGTMLESPTVPVMPAAAAPPPPHTIRLTRFAHYTGTRQSGKPVSLTLAASVYRGRMAAKVLEVLADQIAADPSLVEVLG